MDFSQYFLVGTNMVHHCIEEFLTCPVNLKMLILFRDRFFDMPDIQRVNARRKIGFGFGMITSDVPPSKVHSTIKMIFHNCDKLEAKTVSTKRPGFDLGCHFQCTFRQLL